MSVQDCLRIYDQAVSDFVGGFAVEGRSVLTMFASPDRPFAEVIQKMSESDEEYRSQLMESNLIGSVARMDPQYNAKLRVNAPFGQILPTINGSEVLSEYPRPYVIPYQLDLRSRSRTHANMWIQWVMFKFNPYFCLYPNFGALWGTRQIQLQLNQTVDNSELETGEKERWIRWTVTLKILNAWIFPIVTDTNDIPDPYGMFTLYKVVNKVFVSTYISPNLPPVPDPTLPGVQLVDTAEAAQVLVNASMAVETN